MKNPPISFVKSQIVNAIANHTLELLEREKSGEIDNQHFLACSFPANAIKTIDKAIANSIELFNSEDATNENW